jgi:hypothetical protein
LGIDGSSPPISSITMLLVGFARLETGAMLAAFQKGRR